MLTEICHQYCKNLPLDIQEAAGKSFVYSFITGSVFSLNPTWGIVCGSYAALASCIDALVTPVFCKLNENQPNHQLNWGLRTVKVILTILLTESVAAAVGFSFRMNLLASILGGIGLSLISSQVESDFYKFNGINLKYPSLYVFA
jgi:hypothetical protein